MKSSILRNLNTINKKDRPVPTKTYYCRECGCEMLEELVGAERYFYTYELGKSYPYRKYSRETGKRQYVYEYTCPNKKIFNCHERFMVDEIITI